jgi:hypothetical protein
MSIPKLNQSARLLMQLLEQFEGPPIKGLKEMSMEDRLFMAVTSAAEVLLHSLAIITAADYDAAQRGLETLHMEKRLKAICDEMNAVLEKNRDKWDLQ